MANTPFPARLHIILARDSAQAIVIRRGPAKQVAVIGWDRKKDEFTLGQWFKGHIYAYHSDLSPDGQYFIYFAKESRSRQTWTAISKTPYLKALDFYKQKNTWSCGGGGLFYSNKTYFLNESNVKLKKIFRRSGLIMALKPILENTIDFRLGTYLIRLPKDGWLKHNGNNILTKFGRPKFLFSKKIDNGVLNKLIYNDFLCKEQGKNGGLYERHQLFLKDQIIEYPSWEWADIDGDRIVWTEQGKLMAGKVNKQGLVAIKELYDFNQMTFEERVAPY